MRLDFSCVGDPLFVPGINRIKECKHCGKTIHQSGPIFPLGNTCLELLDRPCNRPFKEVPARPDGWVLDF